MSHKIELVVWRDACQEPHEWMDAEEIEDSDYLVTSVGFVVKETEKNLFLAMDTCEDGQTNGRGLIPKGMIVSREVLTCE